jgi:hypothetical protein
MSFDESERLAFHYDCICLRIFKCHRWLGRVVYVICACDYVLTRDKSVRLPPGPVT